MGVDLDQSISPPGPVFDGNVVVGRRHNERQELSTTDDLLRSMDRCGIERALAYHHHAVAFDPNEGNQLLLEMIEDEPRITPQFAVHLSAERDVESFANGVNTAGVRSLRVQPKDHLYPLTPWVIERWAEWLTEQSLAIWVPMDQTDARDIHDTASAFPHMRFVLVGGHYSHHSVLLPLLRTCSNLYVDLSRYDVPDGVWDLCQITGSGRLLYGSDWPSLDPAPYIWYLARCGLSDEECRWILCGNLCELLGETL